MNVAVLGCGPSGLLAAQAVLEEGHDVTIFSRPEKSPILGGQYLHIEVPGITGDADTVHYLKMGDAEEYARKVYGDPDVPCWNFPAGAYPAWSMTTAYDNLWHSHRDTIDSRNIFPDEIHDYCESFDVVLSTLPRDKMCFKEHKFELQRINVMQGESLIDKEIENIVLYSGRRRDAWYRTSNLFGHLTTEWADHSGDSVEVDLDLFVRGIKPLRTDCDCHMKHDNYFMLGRFGTWRHGVLVSDAYQEAKQLVNVQNYQA